MSQQYSHDTPLLCVQALAVITRGFRIKNRTHLCTFSCCVFLNDNSISHNNKKFLAAFANLTSPEILKAHTSVCIVSVLKLPDKALKIYKDKAWLWLYDCYHAVCIWLLSPGDLQNWNRRNCGQRFLKLSLRCAPPVKSVCFNNRMKATE